MKYLKTTAAALALSALGAFATPAMAQTSGSFTVDLSVTPPTGSVVSIEGLDAFDNYSFGAFSTTNSSTTTVPASLPRFFCVKRSDAGDVKLKFTQSGVANANYFRMTGGGDPITDYIETDLRLQNTQGSVIHNAYADTTHIFAPSPQGCSPNSVSGTAHSLVVAPLALPGYLAKALTGNYSGLITVTVSVP